MCKNKASIFHFCYSNNHTDTSFISENPAILNREAEIAAIFTSKCPVRAFSASDR